MILSTLGSLAKLADDATAIVLAPVKIAADTARILTGPISDLVQDVSDEFGEAAESVKREARSSK